MLNQKGNALLFILIGSGILVLLAVGGFLHSKGWDRSRNNFSSSSDLPLPNGSQNLYGNDAIITSNPVDLSQIKQISKYRSCFGHDYSGMDTQGVAESDHSMKHYFQALPSLGANTIKIMSPFDGTVVMANSQLDAPYGWQMMISSKDDPQEVVVIFHIAPLSGIALNTQVASGELLGYAQPPDGQTFDIAFGWTAHTSVPAPEILDSIFNHMSQAVLSQYQARGLTLSNIIVPKPERDSQSCQYPSNHQVGGPLLNSPDNWIVLN